MNVSNSGVKVTAGSNMPKCIFLALLAGYLQRESTEFRQTFRIDGSWEKDERITFGGHWVKVTAG